MKGKSIIVDGIRCIAQVEIQSSMDPEADMSVSFGICKDVEASYKKKKRFVENPRQIKTDEILVTDDLCKALDDLLKLDINVMNEAKVIEEMVSVTFKIQI